MSTPLTCVTDRVFAPVTTIVSSCPAGGVAGSATGAGEPGSTSLETSDCAVAVTGTPTTTKPIAPHNSRAAVRLNIVILENP
ncbi:hypothetical protein NHF48_005015 [Sphingomonas sp. H160509]|uniref:hypothetical protein n=1 Tax=Sphingomonas sp. H160509 TaxID=2955313 RepID=UPI002097D98A|nr:hypothetical protein [Sphingomonas sp. H160509]MDD1450496.1 hypothetical protein [Sphingomonas sp. H160509]